MKVSPYITQSQIHHVDDMCVKHYVLADHRQIKTRMFSRKNILARKTVA